MVPDQELNLVLLKLVEYLGNENDIITALAFQELSNIAAARGTTTAELFKPFWRGLAHLAVKDVIAQPKITGLVADLLGITVNEFLVKVQSFALPWLILQGKKDVVERISSARKHGNAHSAIVDTANCGPILALLLIQPVDDVAAFTMAKLSDTSSHFVSMEFPQLARSELTQIVLEVFKLAAEGNDARKLAVSLACCVGEAEWHVRKLGLTHRRLEMPCRSLHCFLPLPVNPSPEKAMSSAGSSHPMSWGSWLG